MTVTSAPPIVSRQAWGANPVNTPAAGISTPTAELWLHHTGGSGHGAGYMRSLQSHARSTGYVDLEYTVVVDTDGTIFMSRGIGRDPAATGGRNSMSHAICVMGNFENEPVNDAILDAVASCVKWLYANGAIRTQAITGPHRDAPGNSTACCGRNLIARIGDINARAGGASTGGGGAPATEGVPLTVVASPQRANPQGRTPTARPVPALGCIMLENGAALNGDKVSGSNRVWTSNDGAVKAAGNKLIDIAPTVDGNGRPDGRGVVALFDLGNNQVGTYVLPWS